MSEVERLQELINKDIYRALCNMIVEIHKVPSMDFCKTLVDEKMNEFIKHYEPRKTNDT